MAPSKNKQLLLQTLSQRKRKNFTIAIFRALFLGDMLCSVPAIRSIRKNFPTAKISLIGLPWALEFASLFHSYIDEFILFPGFPGLPEQQYSKKELDRFLSTMKDKKIDLFIQMHGDGRITNSIVREIHAIYSIGYYYKDKPKTNYSLFFPYPTRLSEVEIWNSLIKRIELRLYGNHLEFPITGKDRIESKKIKKEFSLMSQRYICIHPGARDKKRRWSPQNFAAAADIFYKRGFKIVITGSEIDQDIVQKITSRMISPAISLVGKTTLGVLAALLQDAHILLTNDTGVMHLGESIGAKYIVVCTSKESKKWLHHRANSTAINANDIRNVSQLYDLSMKLN